MVEALIPPKQTMADITVEVGRDNKAPRKELEEKLDRLKARGLMDAGLVLVQGGMLQGYLPEAELDFGLAQRDRRAQWDTADDDAGERVRLLGQALAAAADEDEADLDLAALVDRTPLCLCAQAPVEYAVEMFAKLGLRYLCVLEEGTGRLVGVVIKKRLVVWLEARKLA